MNRMVVMHWILWLFMLQWRFVCVSCVLREIRKCDCMDCVDSMCRVTLGTQEQ